MKTFLNPYFKINSVQGPVLPLCEHGSRVQYNVAPLSFFLFLILFIALNSA